MISSYYYWKVMDFLCRLSGLIATINFHIKMNNWKFEFEFQSLHVTILYPTELRLEGLEKLYSLRS